MNTFYTTFLLILYNMTSMTSTYIIPFKRTNANTPDISCNHNNHKHKTTRLCIPTIPNNITSEHIKQCIHKLNIGHISQMRDVLLKFPRYCQNIPCRRVVLQITWNHHNSLTQSIYQRINTALPVHIVHNFPHSFIIRTQL